jgi:predicted neuraminidase
MPNNNSGIDLTQLENGVLLLVYNPNTENFGIRYPISIAASHDGGVTWEKICDLEAEPGEFSYPAIVS